MGSWADILKSFWADILKSFWNFKFRHNQEPDKLEIYQNRFLEHAFLLNFENWGEWLGVCNIGSSEVSRKLQAC